MDGTERYDDAVTHCGTAWIPGSSPGKTVLVKGTPTPITP